MEGTGPPATSSPLPEVERRLERVLEQALARPRPTRAVLGKALRELVREAVSQAGA
jgi:hypothetical protein